MRHETESLLRDELSGHAANAVGLVLDADKGCLKTLDELVLTLDKQTGLFLGKGCSAFLHSLEGWSGVVYVVAVRACHRCPEGLILCASLLKHVKDNRLELLKFFVAVAYIEFGFLFLCHTNPVFLQIY